MIFKKSYSLGKTPSKLLFTAFASSLVLSACGGSSSSGTTSGVDNTPPVITVTGGNADIAVGDTYTDQGATATDDVDTTVTVTSSDNVNESTPGSYTVTYTATDAAGNTTTKTRTVTVSDNTPPVITVTGDNASIFVGDTYTDEGATATDNVDTTVTVNSSDNVDESTPGSYTVTYTATDAAGNTATKTRTVTVSDNTPPVITVTGGTADIFVGDTYTDEGATATDDVDTAVTVNSSDDVDESTAGTYTVTYTATDAAGNTATETRTVNVITPTLSGTAAAGAAIVGTVTVKDSLGVTKSELIEADGSYNVDVTGMTPPFRLRAEGSVGGKVYKLHSYAEQANTDGAVNITPFTDLIIANAAKQVAEAFFDEDTPADLTSEDIATQETALQNKLQSVFTALGLDTAINLLNTSFSADHSGLDAALDIIKIETDANTNVATITNLIDNTSIVDDIIEEEAEAVKLVVADADALTGTVDETIAIANVFKAFNASFSDGLPTKEVLGKLLGSDFLHRDQGREEFLTDVTTDPSVVGLVFSSVSIRDLNIEAGTATVDFNVIANGITEAAPETWQVAKHGELGWQLLGDQLIVEADTLTFHCNDFDGTDSNSGGCGFNASFYDNDFSNNGTNGMPLASATLEIIDGDDGTVKDTVYFGNPSFNGSGELSVYNQTTQSFTSDYVNFGSTEGEVDPSIFAVGDIIRYKLYTEALDITTPAQPFIPSSQAVVSFDRRLLFLPAVTGKYPTLLSKGVDLIEEFFDTNNLTLSWTLQAGTVIDSILVEIEDNRGNRYEIEDEGISRDATSTVIDTTALATAITNDANFDPSSVRLLVRVYSIEPSTGQYHSTDYRIAVGEGENNGGTTGLTCNTESDFDDLSDKPKDFYSINDFKAVIADCENMEMLPSFSASHLAGWSWYVDDEVIEFDDTGANGIGTNYGVDGILGTDDDETFYLTVEDYDTNIVQFSFSMTENGDIVGRDLVRVISDGEIGNNSPVYEARVLWEYYEWDESDESNQDVTHQGAEIYHEVYATDASYYNQ